MDQLYPLWDNYGLFVARETYLLKKNHLSHSGVLLSPSCLLLSRLCEEKRLQRESHARDGELHGEIEDVRESLKDQRSILPSVPRRTVRCSFCARWSESTSSYRREWKEWKWERRRRYGLVNSEHLALCFTPSIISKKSEECVLEMSKEWRRLFNRVEVLMVILFQVHFALYSFYLNLTFWMSQCNLTNFPSHRASTLQCSPSSSLSSTRILSMWVKEGKIKDQRPLQPPLDPVWSSLRHTSTDESHHVPPVSSD